MCVLSLLTGLDIDIIIDLLERAAARNPQQTRTLTHTPPSRGSRSGLNFLAPQHDSQSSSQSGGRGGWGGLGTRNFPSSGRSTIIKSSLTDTKTIPNQKNKPLGICVCLSSQCCREHSSLHACAHVLSTKPPFTHTQDPSSQHTHPPSSVCICLLPPHRLPTRHAP